MPLVGANDYWVIKERLRYEISVERINEKPTRVVKGKGKDHSVGIDYGN